MVARHRHFSSSVTVQPGHYRDYYAPYRGNSDTLMDPLVGPRTPPRPQTAPPPAHPAASYPERHAVSLTDHSTPRAPDFGTQSNVHTGDAATAKDKRKNKAIFRQWKRTHYAYDFPEEGREKGKIEEFLKKFVPSTSEVVSPTCTKDLHDELVALAEKIPGKGKLETTSYGPIIALLKKCQSDLDDGHRQKLHFIDTSRKKLSGPTKHDHPTGPDILVPYPGWDEPEKLTFDKICLALEVKPHEDPVNQKTSTIPEDGDDDDSQKVYQAIAQIVKNGRNLLTFSSACYVFVIGIYMATQEMRIYRFDHSGSVSCGFNYLEKPDFLHEFILRFVNPRHGIPHTMVGWDETMDFPTLDDMKDLKKIVSPFYNWLPIEERHSRWLKVRVDRSAISSGMKLSSVIDPPKNFVRSTLSSPPAAPPDKSGSEAANTSAAPPQVDSTGDHADDPSDSQAANSSAIPTCTTNRHAPSTVESLPISDLDISDAAAANSPAPSNESEDGDIASSQLTSLSALSQERRARESKDQKELPYYDVIGITFGEPLYKSSGLVSRATHVTRILVYIPGHGFFVFVLKDAWRQLLRDPESVYYEQIKKNYPTLKDRDSFKWIKDIYPDIDAKPGWIPGLAEYYGFLDLESPDIHHSTKNSDDRGHTTVTRRLLTGERKSDRARGRALTGPVGGDIADFAKTQDFAAVIRDAVVGHYIARACGVLHRDISNGNILVAKEPSGHVRGFLHDFDYATFYECDEFPDKAKEEELEKRSTVLKVLTGTPQFMAIGVLQKESHMPHHDIESFYWVMVWILLQHAKHTHKMGDEACTWLFDQENDATAAELKRSWITAPDSKKPLVVENNDRLSQLMEDLRDVFNEYHWKERADRLPTHEKFIKAMHEIVKKDGWPKDDHRIKYEGPSQLVFTNRMKSSHVDPLDAQRDAAAAVVGDVPALERDTDQDRNDKKRRSAFDDDDDDDDEVDRHINKKSRSSRP